MNSRTGVRMRMWAGLWVAGVLLATSACGSSPSDAASSSAAAPGSGGADISAAPSGSSAAAAGGSSASSQSMVQEAPRAVPDGMGSTAKDGEFPRTVTHFGGSTTIPAPPVRTVVISTGQLDATLTLGVVPVGSTRGAGAELVPPYLNETFADRAGDLAAMQDLGLRLEPNVEAIAAAQPDLILVNAAGAEGIYDKLSQIAPTVQSEGTGVNWKQDFLLVADALGRTEQAQAYLDTYHQTATDYGQRFTSAPTVSLIRTTSDRTRMFGIPSFPGSIAQDAGLDRPASQQFDSTSLDVAAEQIAEVDADWIFYGVQSGADPVTANPLWPTLSAVAAQRVIDVDDDLWYLNAGPTAAAAVLEQLMSTIEA